MELGICVASKIDDIDYIVRAEALGYTHAWVADSQMLWSDPYAVLALAADRTSTIRLGTGVAVAATRPAPVTAASIATINALAPGRTFLGVGTGNTAMRVMGHKPMRIAEFDEYLATLRPLLRGEQVDFTWRGRTAPIRHLMPDDGFVNFADEIPMYVSGFGPRSLAARRPARRRRRAVDTARSCCHGEGVVEHRGGRGRGGPGARPRPYLTCSLTTMVVLEPGEARDSERVRRLCGAFAMASLHYVYDQWRQYDRPPSGRLRQRVGRVLRPARPRSPRSSGTSASTPATTAGCSPRRSAS